MSLRVIVPDSHGSFICQAAMKAFLKDLKALDPEEIVMLGDHVDVGGILSSHKKSAKEDLEYSYMQDIECANVFLDAIQKCAPRAQTHYLEGNHCGRLERWACNTFDNKADANYLISKFAPQHLLKLNERGIKFYRMHQFYQGCSVPGTIKLGKCYFVHGISANKFATATHVERFGANVCHGHVHRAQSHVIRTVASGEIGAWCPGTLMELQPTYQHSSPSNWSHGYAVQLVNKSSQTFLHINVPIVKGISMLNEFVNRVK